MTLTWTNERRKLSDLTPWPRNPRQIDDAQSERLGESWDEFGQVETLAIGPDNSLYDGHQRLKVLAERHGPDYEVDVRVSSRPLTEKEREKLTVMLVKASGEWDWDLLGDWDVEELVEWGFDEGELDGVDFGDDEQDLDLPSGDEQDLPEQFMIMIECSSEIHQTHTLEKLVGEGYQCRALLS